MSEWDSIISLGKAQNSYGTCVRSTAKHVIIQNTERHYLEENDTLQGIALKYSTTTEELRRMNKLFFSESIFQRAFLLVPETKQKENKIHNKTVSSPPEVKKSPKKIPTKVVEQEDKKDTPSVADFLKNMDSQIRASKQATKQITKKELSFTEKTEHKSNSEYYKVMPNHTTRPNLNNDKYQEEMFRL